MMRSRRWCLIWSKKFPSLHHDPVENFTYCRLCRNSDEKQSQSCAWATGLGPPTSGWRVRRVIRHLLSKEHTIAHEAAVNRCKRAIEYEANLGEDSINSIYEEHGTPIALFGTPNEITEAADPLTFQEILKLLNAESMMVQDYHNKQAVPARNRISKKRTYSDLCDGERPSMVVKNPKPYKSNFIELNEINHERYGNSQFNNSDPRPYYGLQITGSEVGCENEHETQHYSDMSMKLEDFGINGGGDFMNSKGCARCLNASYDSRNLTAALEAFAQGQTRLAEAVESMAQVQMEMLTVWKQLSNKLCPNNNSAP